VACGGTATPEETAGAADAAADTAPTPTIDRLAGAEEPSTAWPARRNLRPPRRWTPLLRRFRYPRPWLWTNDRTGGLREKISVIAETSHWWLSTTPAFGTCTTAAQ
jgi:hypothetical protein